MRSIIPFVQVEEVIGLYIYLSREPVKLLKIFHPLSKVVV
tara:strand:+ start:305 stop:424 length:120 start_codon:yes stop_codon:yes gene_type:complete